MTKKHFIQIAKDFRLVQEQGGDLKLLASHLCTTFKQLNPEFDRERFMTACGF